MIQWPVNQHSGGQAISKEKKFLSLFRTVVIKSRSFQPVFCDQSLFVYVYVCACEEAYETRKLNESPAVYHPLLGRSNRPPSQRFTDSSHVFGLVLHSSQSYVTFESSTSLKLKATALRWFTNLWFITSTSRVILQKWILQRNGPPTFSSRQEVSG